VKQRELKRQIRQLLTVEISSETLEEKHARLLGCFSQD